MTDRHATVKEVWNQKEIPVAFRTSAKGIRVRVRIPFGDGNRQWLRNERRNEPEWNKRRRCWEIPKAWFNDFVDRAIEKYGQVWVIQPYRAREVCAPSCRTAVGHECQCSCMGRYHGIDGGAGWLDISETFSVRYEQTEYACRKLTPKDRGQA